MFISFCKVFIDENMFRGRFPWSITFQFPSFFINIVSGSSRDKSNNNVWGLVCFWFTQSVSNVNIMMRYIFIYFLSTVKTLLSVSELFALSLMGIPCISKFCLLPYCSESLISNSREDILFSSNWFFCLRELFSSLRPLISLCSCSTFIGTALRVLARLEIWFGIDSNLDVFESSWLSFSSNSSDLSIDVCGESTGHFSQLTISFVAWFASLLLLRVPISTLFSTTQQASKVLYN